MAQSLGFGGVRGAGYFREQRGRPSHQRDFLDYMRQREPEAWRTFMDNYRGYNFDGLSMHELEGRFRDVVQHVRRRNEAHLNYGEVAWVAPIPPKPKTWFEEIQAEVNEWLKGVS